MELAVDPVLQEYVFAPLAVIFADDPLHKVFVPTTFKVGTGFTIKKCEAETLQLPLAPTTE